jgi:hypothetical protein
MLEKTAKSRKELLDVMDAVEMLGFKYTISSFPSGEAFLYKINIGTGEVAASQEGATAALKPRKMKRRTPETRQRHNRAISEYLKNKSGSVSCEQIHSELKNLGHEWNPQSTTSILQMAMNYDNNIIKTGHGMYGYRRIVSD